nr:MAG: hypothetical protein [Lake Baikal virophage 12]
MCIWYRNEMEQIQNEMRANQGKKNSLANRRAMELEAKHPQLSEYDNQLEPTEPMRGGGDAGLARVVGSGKRKSKKMEMMVEDEPMSGGAKQGKMLATHLRKLHGEGFFQDFWKGFTSVIRPVANIASMIPIPGIQQAGQLASGVLGGGKCEMCRYKKCRCSGGMISKYGRPQDQPYYKEMMAKRQQEMDDMMAKQGKGRAGAGRAGAGRAGAGMCGGGNQIAHANTEGNRVGLAGQALGGQDLPPNSVAPRTYGNTPSAPASFARNTVGMGRAGAGMAGAGMAGASNGKMKKPRAPTARGAMVSKLMKEQGMSLGEASRYIKQHGLA